MPDVLAGLSGPERNEHVEALVHFLASTGSVMETMPNRAGISRGETLFHRAGCVACHEPVRGEGERRGTSVPFLWATFLKSTPSPVWPLSCATRSTCDRRAACPT